MVGAIVETAPPAKFSTNKEKNRNLYEIARFVRFRALTREQFLALSAKFPTE